MKNLAIIAILLSTADSFGAGYEKAVIWSAKNSALGAAVSSSVSGADALFFNPAGLSKTNGKEVTINLSPTLAQAESSVNTANLSNKSEEVLSIPAAVMGAMKINEKLGVGIGIYAAGGTAINHESVDFSGVSSEFAPYRPNIESNLRIVELGIGAGYTLNKNWSVGAVWRATLVNADFSDARVTESSGGVPLLLSGTEIDDIKDEKFSGFRLGAQYLADSKKWGFGFSYRSAVEFTGEGESSVSYALTTAGNAAILSGAGTAGVRVNGTGGDASITSELPQQLSVGGHCVLDEKWTLFGEVTWTEYSSNERLKIDGNVTTFTTSAIPDVEQNWKDQFNYRLAAQYTGWEKGILRFSYVLTTRVTSDQAATPTFSVPGEGHTVTVGLGNKLTKNLYLDTALEYSFSSGEGNTTDRSASSTLLTPPFRGDYELSGYIIHASLAYRW